MLDLVVQAFAQDSVSSAASDHAVDMALSWVCTNPTLIKPVLYLFGAWLANNIVSAAMKKYGLTQDSPAVGWLVWIVRKVALDVHPPDKVIVKNAATIMSDPERAAPVIAQTKVDEAVVVAATKVADDKIVAAAKVADATVTHGDQKMNRIFALAILIPLAGCPGTIDTPSTQEINTVFSSLAGACVTAEAALAGAQQSVKGGALNTVNSYGPYINSVCSTASAIGKVATDPSTLEWIGTMTGALNTLAKPVSQ